MSEDQLVECLTWWSDNHDVLLVWGGRPAVASQQGAAGHLPPEQFPHWNSPSIRWWAALHGIATTPQGGEIAAAREAAENSGRVATGTVKGRVWYWLTSRTAAVQPFLQPEE